MVIGNGPVADDQVVGQHAAHGLMEAAADAFLGHFKFVPRLEPAGMDFAQLRELLMRAVDNIHEVVNQSTRFTIPALKNIPAGEALRGFLLQKPLVRNLAPTENTISPEWLQPFLAQMAEVQDRLKRLLFKSMGGMLAYDAAGIDFPHYSGAQYEDTERVPLYDIEPALGLTAARLKMCQSIAVCWKSHLRRSSSFLTTGTRPKVL